MCAGCLAAWSVPNLKLLHLTLENHWNCATVDGPWPVTPLASWNLANCVTVVFGASPAGLPCGPSNCATAVVGSLWGPLELCTCRPWEHCDPPKANFTPFETLLVTFMPHLVAFAPLPIHFCDVWHCITVNKALTQLAPSGFPPLSHWDPPRSFYNVYTNISDSICDSISKRFCEIIYGIFCDRFKWVKLYTRPTSRPTPLHYQIHLTLCMYMRRSSLVYIYIYNCMSMLSHGGMRPHMHARTPCGSNACDEIPCWAH